jgi:hypothetical protein
MSRRLLAALFLLLTTPPAAHADEKAVPPPASGGVEAAPENTDKALKIAGLVAFVANSCPNLVPDYDRFKAVISTLGLEVEELSKNELQLKYLNYAAIYQKDIPGGCEKAQSLFGDGGTMLKGLFHPK